MTYPILTPLDMSDSAVRDSIASLSGGTPFLCLHGDQWMVLKPPDKNLLECRVLYSLPVVPRKRVLFSVIFQYFKQSGKLYTEGKERIECDDCGSGDVQCCYMPDAVEWFERRRAGNHPVPGLSSSGREFFVVIDCEKGCPVLRHPYPHLEDKR